MKKIIPFLISSMMLVSAFGCQETPKDAFKTPSTTNEASQPPAKSASQTSQTTEKTAATKNTTTNTKSEGQLKKEVTKKLKGSLPGNKLEVETKAGEIVIKGTAASGAELEKAEKLIKEIKGVKSVKMEAKVQPPNKI